jgi:hypothetical protein
MSATVTVTVNEQGFYDDVEIEDMEYDESTQTYYFPCPWYGFLLPYTANCTTAATSFK